MINKSVFEESVEVGQDTQVVHLEVSGWALQDVVHSHNAQQPVVLLIFFVSQLHTTFLQFVQNAPNQVHIDFMNMFQ